MPLPAGRPFPFSQGTPVRLNPFVVRCLRDTLTGLRDGLSLFSGPSRAAVIFSLEEEDELYIFDPQNLLRGHEVKLKAFYGERREWCRPFDGEAFRSVYNYIEPQDNLRLDGMLCMGGSSAPVFYQMWFTEHHPHFCSVLPTLCWLEHVVLRFSHDIAKDSTLYTGISGNFLREYATHAIHDCILDKAGAALGPDFHFHVYPILETVLGVSKTNEEQVRPQGLLTFIEPRFLDDIPWIAKFKSGEQPLLENFKHVRKLLQAVEFSQRTLIADGKYLIGIADGPLDHFHITADYRGKLGFLSVDGETLCSFHDGRYSSDTHRAKLFELEEALLDFELGIEVGTAMFAIVTSLVHFAQEHKYGCSFVIDLAPVPTTTSGQMLSPPIDLREPRELALAAGLAKVDGALHLRADLHLHAFACLLDGHRVENEDRSRGARYNSALRFTAQHRDTLVVVVSSDRPVSTFRHGREITNRFGAQLGTQCDLYPLTLEEWLAGAE